MQLADAETTRTIRHEGAHQMFFDYGIHGLDGLEHIWLIEGLAVYCEEREPGDMLSYRALVLKKLQHSRYAMSLKELVNNSDARGFYELQSSGAVEYAYAQAWSLVHMLMTRYQEPFFEYIRFVRDPANRQALEKESRFSLLTRIIGIKPRTLTRAWERYIDDMPLDLAAVL